MKLPVTIDPRHHDAVIFDLDGVLTDTACSDAAACAALLEPTVALVRKLQGADVATAAHSSSPHCQQVLKAAGVDDLFDVFIDRTAAGELGIAGNSDPAVRLEATRRLGVRPQRSVVVEDADAGVIAGRDGGFALVIGVDRTGHTDELLRFGADVVVADLADVAVRTDDKRISELPNALASYGQLIGITSARESVLFLDYDGTLSPIVSDPGAATLVDGAVEALELVAAVCPVAVLSGRDLADIPRMKRPPPLWLSSSARPPSCATAWRRFREYEWSTSASPSQFTTARSHRSTSVRSSLQHIGWDSELAYG
jgi:alpha,alpha-trehalase